jgi:outer membrane immunogenic protein
MRRILTTAAAVLTTIASAAAADLPFKAPAPMPVFSWSGFYIGAHVGAGWAQREFDYNDLTAGAPFLWDSSIPGSGPLVGGQIGVNWQAGWAVFGLEADGSWASLKGAGICNSTIFFLNCSAETKGIATFAGRLGVDFDRTLVFLKGGGAYIHETSTISNVALPPLATAFSTSLDNNRWGWMIGMGLEYAFAPHWSVKLEYDFMDFGSNRVNFPVAGAAFIPAATFTNWDLVDRIQTMTVGINYRF